MKYHRIFFAQVLDLCLAFVGHKTLSLTISVTNIEEGENTGLTIHVHEKDNGIIGDFEFATWYSEEENSETLKRFWELVNEKTEG